VKIWLLIEGGSERVRGAQPQQTRAVFAELNGEPSTAITRS